MEAHGIMPPLLLQEIQLSQWWWLWSANQQLRVASGQASLQSISHAATSAHRLRAAKGGVFPCETTELVDEDLQLCQVTVTLEPVGAGVADQGEKVSVGADYKGELVCDDEVSLAQGIKMCCAELATQTGGTASGGIASVAINSDSRASDMIGTVNTSGHYRILN